MPERTGPGVGERVTAMGGVTTVPAPDPVAGDYLRLALRLDQRIPGLVDGYFGPADIKAGVDLEQLRAPAALRDDAAALRQRVAAEVADPARRAWLDAQLVALETHAAVLAGESIPYLEVVMRSFAFEPQRRPDEAFEAAAAEIDRLLPGVEPLDERLEAWDRRFEIPLERLPAVIDWLVDRFRRRAAAQFALPDGEALTVSLVTGRPWSGYNWYDGGRRSRVEINTDLPVRVPALVDTVAHETYPGHHLEHAWKEADLVGLRGRLEASVLLINTPECLISEGLADLGASFAIPDDERADVLHEVMDRAGLADTATAGDPRDAGEARHLAELAAALAPPRRVLRAIAGNAALRRHADGRSHEDVVDYLRSVGRYSAVAAEKRLEFIEHPLWRTYVFVYADGEALLRRWLDAVPTEDRVARFGRLLHEQLTPADVTTAG